MRPVVVEASLLCGLVRAAVEAEPDVVRSAVAPAKRVGRLVVEASLAVAAERLDSLGQDIPFERTQRLDD